MRSEVGRKMKGISFIFDDIFHRETNKSRENEKIQFLILRNE
jgi:hypothetical protein